MTENMKTFLNALADLCEKHSAELSYTTDDDGVHVEINDENVCIGFPTMPNPGDDIRNNMF